MKSIRGPRAGAWLALLLGAAACAHAPAPTVTPPSAGRPAVTEGEVVPVETLEPPVDAAPRAALAEAGRVEVGHAYADFVAVTVGEDTLRLSDYVGSSVVVLQFWGVRCKPCLEEMSFLAGLQREHAEGLQVVGVNTDRATAPKLRQVMAARGIEPAYPVVADPDFAISQRYTQWLVPVTVLIDRRGTVRAIHTGFNGSLRDALRAEVEAALKEER